MIWGRDELEWNQLTDETARFLVERARMERTTSYTELNSVLHQRTGAPLFDFGLDRDRAAMGALLGEVAVRMRPEIGALISSIVLYLNENDAGSGFYALARDEGLLGPIQPQSNE